MPERVAEQGDTISGYAREAGITVAKIWNHPRNRELRARREHPNILHPGDVVYVPDREQEYAPAATEQRHRFSRRGSLEVSVALLDVYHKPLEGVEYHFSVDGEKGKPGKTDSSGIVRVRIPSATSQVRLHLPWGEFPLEVGCLDPTRTIKGIQKRLRNLGIDPGPIDGIMGPRTARAIREFQLAEAGAGLQPTGMADEETIRRLRAVHDQQTLEGLHNRVELHAPPSATSLSTDELDSETPEVLIEYDDLGAAEDVCEAEPSE